MDVYNKTFTFVDVEPFIHQRDRKGLSNLAEDAVPHLVQ